MVQTGNTDDVIMICLCIFLPIPSFQPIAVFWKDNVDGNGCSCHVCVNLLLTLFFYIPGLLHAAWYCFCRG
uniref:Protein SNA4 n=1 Tax=Bursaphelenchus xylophilus TaxID=6326 RepID=A0A1I7SDH4_BURXY